MRCTRSFRLALAFAMLLLAATVIPAGAVTNGERDSNDDHPYVGAAVFTGEGGSWLCSGSFIDDDLFLTAAHCTDGADTATVLVGRNFTSPDNAIAGEPRTHPDFDDFAELPQTYDIGVVELSESVDLDTYPEIAPLGYIDEIVDQSGREDVEFTVVGYGIQHSQVTGAEINEDGEPELTFDDTIDGWRYLGQVNLVTLNSAYTDGHNLQHSGNSGDTSGGTCFGDSGGPVLHDGAIVGITSFGIGNPMCRGNTGFAYRTDIETSREFLDPYLSQ